MLSTPPLSPTSSRDAAHHLEHSHRIMGSPENCHIPTDPSNSSTFTHSFRVQPINLSTQLSSIPLPQHNGPQASTSIMAAPAPSSHQQTLSSAQLRAAFAALPPLNPQPIPLPQHDGPQASTSTFMLAPPHIITPMAAPAPPSHRQTLSSAQLRAAFAALPPLNPQSRGPPLPSLNPQPRGPSLLTPAQLADTYAALPPLHP